MTFAILSDFVNGFFHSMRMDAILYYLIDSAKIRGVIVKMCFTELLMTLFIYCVGSDGWTSWSLTCLAKFTATIYAFLNTIEFISAIEIKNVRPNKSSPLDTACEIVTMFAYQFSMTVLVTIINSILFYPASYVVNFFVLLIYHSFYSYNNLWQKKGISVNARIETYECHWAHFFGFGTIPTALYLCNQHVVYNLYLFLYISIPFYLPDLDSKYNYPKINMKIFAYMCEWGIIAFNYIFRLKNNS